MAGEKWGKRYSAKMHWSKWEHSKAGCAYKSQSYFSFLSTNYAKVFLLKFSKQISIFPDVNQWFLQTNQKVLHFYIFSK